MPDESNPMDNIQRLLAHLKDDSLAARLVGAYRDAQGHNPGEGLRAILTARLEQVKAELDGRAD
jgi:hypothetical protein